ncbi:hypothetical protein [Arthrobacter sp. HY1533]|uniref:hypothetical protein n=1 Tax=Arthrobacter sp. HY1533 TaxID=2970919 RepID=UPI0022B9EAFF|nr:hypothetical protein [Arthrobacter sp. HY1533]
MENQSTSEAHEALDAIAGARGKAADRLVTPWWYHPALGLLAAAFVVAVTAGGTAVMIGVSLLYFIGLGILMGAYKQKTGVWINGLKAGRASWWTVPLMVIMVACLVGPYYLHAAHGLVWPAWLAGAIVFVAVNVFGRFFDTALRAQLRSMP